MSDESFASSLFGAIPTEQVRPVASRIAALIRFAIDTESSGRSETSAYTSSIPMSWTVGLTDRTASLNSRECRR